MNQTTMEQLKAIRDVLVKYEIIPVFSDEQLVKFVEDNKDLVADYASAESGKLMPDVMATFREVIPRETLRLLDEADWWFDVGEEGDHNYENILGLTDKVVTSVPAEEGNNVIKVSCGSEMMLVKYANFNAVGRFAVAYGINAINSLAEKMAAPRRLIEIVDRGEDFALYAGVSKERAEQFRNDLSVIFGNESVTEMQTMVENNRIR